MDSRSDRIAAVTTDAAKALIHARLRHHIAVEERELLHRRSQSDGDHWDRVVDLALTFENSSEAAWITVLGLWRGWKHDDAETHLRLCIACALAHAIRDSDHQIQGVLDRHPEANVRRWVIDFVETFDHESLLVWLRIDGRGPVVCRGIAPGRTDTIVAEDDVPF
jgi:hypothetical protein